MCHTFGFQNFSYFFKGIHVFSVDCKFDTSVIFQWKKRFFYFIIEDLDLFFNFQAMTINQKGFEYLNLVSRFWVEFALVCCFVVSTSTFWLRKANEFSCSIEGWVMFTTKGTVLFGSCQFLSWEEELSSSYWLISITVSILKFSSACTDLCLATLRLGVGEDSLVDFRKILIHCCWMLRDVGLDKNLLILTYVERLMSFVFL